MSDHRRDIVEGPPKWGLPWRGKRDLDVGVAPARGPAPKAPPAQTPKRPASRTEARVERKARPAKSAPTAPATTPTATTGKAPGWRRLPVQLVLVAALLFHLLGPGAALLTSSDLGARGLIGLFDAIVPPIFGVDLAKWVVPGAAAWMWQPIPAFVGAAALRFVALNTVERDPLGAIWIAAGATAIDAATWLFVGLRLWGAAFTPAEGEALVTLLKIEAAALLVLFFVLAPTGKKRLGQTDADWHGDN